MFTGLLILSIVGFVYLMYVLVNPKDSDCLTPKKRK